VGVTWGEGTVQHRHTASGAGGISVRDRIERWVRAMWHRLFAHEGKALAVLVITLVHDHDYFT
jgi:hypothetical protein